MTAALKNSLTDARIGRSVVPVVGVPTMWIQTHVLGRTKTAPASGFGGFFASGFSYGRWRDEIRRVTARISPAVHLVRCLNHLPPEIFKRLRWHVVTPTRRLIMSISQNVVPFSPVPMPMQGDSSDEAINARIMQQLFMRMNECQRAHPYFALLATPIVMGIINGVNMLADDDTQTQSA